MKDSLFLKDLSGSQYLKKDSLKNIFSYSQQCKYIVYRAKACLKNL